MKPMMRALAILMVAPAVMLLVNACGSTSSSGAALASPSPSSSHSSPSPSASPSPSTVASTYAVHLAFSGGVKATIDTVQPDPSSVCRTGEIDVVLIVQGETWSLKASVDSYRGPGTYASPSFSVFIATSNNDLWLSTSGSGAYASDTALSLNVVITNMMAGPGEPGSSAHVTGSIRCT